MAHGPEMPPESYAKAIKGLNTFARLIEHTERVEPKDYQSTTRSQYVSPTAHTAWTGPITPGPREQRRLEAHKAMVAKQLEADANKKVEIERRGTYQTATASNYQYDPERFREEVEHIKHLKEKRGSKYRQRPTYEPQLGGKFPVQDYKTDTAISWYSMSLKDESRNPNFAISAANGRNPFARSSTFTSSVWHEPHKVHEGALDMPGHTPSGLGVTVLQKRVLEDVRRRVLEVAGGMSDQHMAAIFGAFDTNNDHRISIHEFVDGLSRLGLELDDKELAAILGVFDRNHDLTITPEEFFTTLKRLD